MNLLIDPDELKAELAVIDAESIGWLPLGVSLICMKRLITGLSFSSFN